MTYYTIRIDGSASFAAGTAQEAENRAKAAVMALQAGDPAAVVDVEVDAMLPPVLEIPAKVYAVTDGYRITGYRIVCAAGDAGYFGAAMVDADSGDVYPERDLDRLVAPTLNHRHDSRGSAEIAAPVEWEG